MNLYHVYSHSLSLHVNICTILDSEIVCAVEMPIFNVNKTTKKSSISWTNQYQSKRLNIFLARNRHSCFDELEKYGIKEILGCNAVIVALFSGLIDSDQCPFHYLQRKSILRTLRIKIKFRCLLLTEKG